MPFVAVTAHRLLGDVAALRMALELLGPESKLSDDQVAHVRATVERRLDSLEDGLRELIVAPRE